MADNAEFFDILYQQWAKTTGAEKTYWMPEESREQSICETDSGLWDFNIYSVEHESQDKVLVATGLTEADAEFICGLHGAIPDLIRQLIDSSDEAERTDELRDEANGLLADALLENQELVAQIHELERQLNG